MTRLIIDVFERPQHTEALDGGYLAVACESGKLVEHGGVGAGISQRLAVEAAVRSFYNKPLVSEPLSQGEDSYAAQVRAFEDEERRKQRDAWDASTPPQTQRGMAKVVAVSAPEIEQVLTAAIQNDFAPLRMVYQDAGGNRTERVIEPFKFETRRPELGFAEKYVHAKDVEKQQPRLFRLSRIERLEVV